VEVFSIPNCDRAVRPEREDRHSFSNSVSVAGHELPTIHLVLGLLTTEPTDQREVTELLWMIEKGEELA